MESQQSNASNLEVKKTVTFEPIVVDSIYEGKYQKEGTVTAQLKQTVVTLATYPTKSVVSSLQNNIFGTEEFGFQSQEYTSKETRVAWINVPVGSTIESVTAKLKEFPKARLYRVLSNKPILSDIQEYAVKQGTTSVDIIADRQVVRYPKGSENEGKLILSNGKPQYREVFFHTDGLADMDSRDADPANTFVTEAIKAEMSTNPVKEQTVL